MRRPGAAEVSAAGTLSLEEGGAGPRQCWACGCAFRVWPTLEATPAEIARSLSKERVATDTLLFAPVVMCGACQATNEFHPKTVRQLGPCERFGEVFARTGVACCVAFVILGGVLVALPFHLERLSIAAPTRLAHYALAVALSVGTFWTYQAASLCEPGLPPRATPGRIAAVRRRLGGVLTGCRICTICDPPCIKLPGTSHCSRTGRCILRFDHSCVFVGQAVGLWNHRTYLLFLIYLTLSCAYVLLWVVPHVYGSPLGDAFFLTFHDPVEAIRVAIDGLGRPDINARQIGLSVLLIHVTTFGIGAWWRVRWRGCCLVTCCLRSLGVVVSWCHGVVASWRRDVAMW